MSLLKGVDGERWRCVEDERFARHGEVLEEICLDDPEVQLYECRVAKVRHGNDVEEDIEKGHLHIACTSCPLCVMGALFYACKSIAPPSGVQTACCTVHVMMQHTIHV